MTCPYMICALKGFMLVLILFGFGLVCTELLCKTGLDAFISDVFFVPGASCEGRPFGQDPFRRFMYDYGTIPVWLLLAASLSMYAASLRGLLAARLKRPCLVVILTIAIGPGLLVNGLLKPCWGRPRPVDTTQSAGTERYRPIWPPGGPGAGKSFPCGHCSMAFSFISGASLVSTHPVAATVFIVAGLAYGFTMGVTRIAQGGHYPTDVVWSGVIVLMVILCLHYLILRVPEQDGREPRLTGRVADVSFILTCRRICVIIIIVSIKSRIIPLRAGGCAKARIR